MYDPKETDLSHAFVKKLADGLTGLRWALLGGWGVYFMVKGAYQEAFGKEYLRSRDIDVFISHRDEVPFLELINKLGFRKSAYPFRYELIYDREQNEIVPEASSKSKPLFSLIYLFLDVFSDKKTDKVGSWVFPELQKATIVRLEAFPVLSIGDLLALKITSFFEREKLDKELKDACDIFALLCYSASTPKISRAIVKAVEKVLSRPDLQHYIAEQVLGDGLKSSLVIAKLRSLAKSVKGKMPN